MKLRAFPAVSPMQLSLADVGRAANTQDHRGKRERLFQAAGNVCGNWVASETDG